jgi:hypothetical protein
MIRSLLLLILVRLMTAQQLFHPGFRNSGTIWKCASLAIPLAGRVRARHASAEFYYRIPDRNRSALRSERSEDPAGLDSHGEVVFHSAKEFTVVNAKFTDVRNMAWYRHTDMPVDRQGILPFCRYVVRAKGKVAVTFDSPARVATRGYSRTGLSSMGHKAVSPSANPARTGLSKRPVTN